ncbi:MAG: elongation factor G [bacterium]
MSVKEYQIDKLRNVGLLSHGGEGKTSIAEAMLFDAKMVNRLGKVDDGSSNLDYEPDEISRKLTINSALAYCEWKKHKINIIDTPGDINFIADAKGTLRVIDSAILVISAVGGVKVQTENFWSQARELNIPVLVFINKMGRERADFYRTVEELSDSLGMNPLVLYLPIGAEQTFKGIIDLFNQKAYVYKGDDSGEYQEESIPADLKDRVEEYRQKMIETIAEADDSLLEKYLDGEELTPEELQSSLRKGIKNMTFTPVLCGSAMKNMGIQQLMDMIVDFMPSPLDRPEVEGTNKAGETITRKASEEEPFSAFVFKTIADPYSGKLTIFRVFSGSLSSDSTVYNTTKDCKEKIGQIFALMGKNHQNYDRVKAGDIAAFVKLKETTTGDTLSDDHHSIIFPPVTFPTPIISFAIEPKTKGDEDKVSNALHRQQEEDPTLHVARDPQTKEFIISGMGQIHIEVAIDRMKRKFGTEVLLKTPKIPYKETIRASTKIQGKYKRQSGGRGQYGDTWLEIEPLPKGGGFEFVDKIVGGVIPRQYIPAVEKGIVGAMEEGILAGFPVTDVRVTLYDGSFHAVDSSEMAFKIAGSMGFKKGFMECKPTLLEPVMKVAVIVPEESMGDIMGDLNSRRGRIQGIDTKGHYQIIRAEVPMAEMMKYAPDLISMTGGRGNFTMEFSHYDEVPAHLLDKIVAEAKKEKEES